MDRVYPGAQRVQVNEERISMRFAGESTASGPVKSDPRILQICRPDACTQTNQVKLTWDTLEIHIRDPSLGKQFPGLCCIWKPMLPDSKDRCPLR